MLLKRLVQDLVHLGMPCKRRQERLLLTLYQEKRGDELQSLSKKEPSVGGKSTVPSKAELVFKQIVSSPSTEKPAVKSLEAKEKEIKGRIDLIGGDSEENKKSLNKALGMLPTDSEKSAFLDELSGVRERKLPTAIDTRIKISEKATSVLEDLGAGMNYREYGKYVSQRKSLCEILEDKKT
ncbi:MAG: hypothetical protein V4489_04975 [Chlamydiota bacterium]